jgi:hypothetical protein
MTQAMLSRVRWRISDTLASPQVWKAIGEARGGSAPVLAKPLVNVSHYLSDAAEFIGGLREGEEIQLQGNLILADEGQLELNVAADAEAPDDQRYFEFALLSGADVVLRTVTFIGIVLSFAEVTGVSEAVMFQANIKVNSLPVRDDP